MALNNASPLALSAALNTRTNALALGLEHGAADLLELVTPTTAELLQWWFGEDMVAARSGLNFHAGQKQAILNAIVAHEVLGAASLLDLYQQVAFCKISENRHTFARLRYVKDDGLPAFYSPDFLVRTASGIFLVETKAQQQAIHPNVQRKLKAAIAWCERINALAPEHRQGLPWHYVLLAEDVVHEWQAKGAHLAELLDYAWLRPLASASLQASLL